jgi:hypothetical protein
MTKKWSKKDAQRALKNGGFGLKTLFSKHGIKTLIFGGNHGCEYAVSEIAMQFA